MAKIRGGYYIKARCVQESEIAIAPPHVREIWDWFLMQANHSSEKKYGHVLEKGQLLCTYAEIQEGLHWMVGWRKQTYSKSDCETSMKWLKKRGNVTTKKTTRGMIVTICNYEYFQNPKNYENHNRTRTRTTIEPQHDDTIDKKKRIEEERKKKKHIYGTHKNVLLKNKEYEKLKESFGEFKAKKWIETLSEGIALKGYKYESHYLAILKWSKNKNGQLPKASTGSSEGLADKDYHEGTW